MAELTSSDLLDEQAFELIWAFVLQHFGAEDETLEKAVVAMRTVSAILEAQLGLPQFEVIYTGESDD